MKPPADPWGAMTAWLQGEPLPELPGLPGRVHRAKPETVDRHALEWERRNRKGGSSSAWTWATSKAHEVGR